MVLRAEQKLCPSMCDLIWILIINFSCFHFYSNKCCFSWQYWRFDLDFDRKLSVVSICVQMNIFSPGNVGKF